MIGYTEQLGRMRSTTHEESRLK